ncbi:hypothetical protein E2C01_071956 [Portunus trituberculatus]|uniref:Uncharacterized protein n=1 Tax=Portunus trituberculatus TaxID=210409 RepID=A0A5B7HYF1_PORTR|nr:hypothetical protein [Portunus trituberculatus]
MSDLTHRGMKSYMFLCPDPVVAACVFEELGAERCGAVRCGAVRCGVVGVTRIHPSSWVQIERSPLLV